MDKQKFINYTPPRSDQGFGNTVQKSKALKVRQMRELVHELNSYRMALETQSEKLLYVQKQLTSSEKKYLTLFSVAPFPYLVLSKIGLIQETNRAFAKLIGIQRSAPLNKPFLEFTAPASQDIFHEHFRKVLKTKSKQSCKLTLVRTSKAPLHVQLESVYMQSKDEGAVHVCSAMLDITAQTETDKNLTCYCNRLEEMIKSCTLELQKTKKQFHTHPESRKDENKK